MFIFENATEDQVSGEVSITGQTFFTVTGELPSGIIRLSAKINGDFVSIFDYSSGSQRCWSIFMPAGVILRGEIKGASEGTSVTLAYIQQFDGCYLVDDAGNFLIDDEGLRLVSTC